MNRRIGWVLVVFGLMLAVGTGALVFLLLRQQETRAFEQARVEAQAAAPVVATMQLPVAARPIAPGTVLGPDDLLLKDFPLDLVPVAAITQTISLESKVVVEPIGQGETISTRQLAGDTSAALSRKIPAGKVIFAYPIDTLLTEIDVVNDGDHIDLLVTMPVGISDPNSPVIDMGTFFTLQNIEVFEVLRPTPVEEGQPAGAPTALLLVMSPDDAVILKHAKDSGGVLDFVLRSVLDSEPFSAPSIDRNQMIERFVRR